MESPKIKRKKERISAIELSITNTMAGQQDFEDLLAKHIRFALEKGYEISGKDFFHTHLVVDKKTGEVLGLVGHAHEYDGKRKKNNYILFTSVQCTSQILIGGKTKAGWDLGWDGPPVSPTGSNLYFPAGVEFKILKKGKKCEKDEKELVIKVKINGKTKRVRICYKIV